MAAFVSSEHLEGLREGQRLSTQPGTEEHLRLTVASLGPGVLDPEEARERFALNSAQKTAVEEPTVVAMAPLEANSGMQEGRIYEAQVEVGTRPAISVVPVLGEWLGKSGERQSGA